MTDYDLNELAAAINLMLEQLRPGSMQARVLEAMVNKPDNGLPRMTYDLDVANSKLASSMPDLQIPTIWELIGLDVAPYPGLWQRIEYARDNWKSIRNAIYNLKEQFEGLGDRELEDGTIVPSVSLFIFNKNGPDSRDINVVTPMADYCNAYSLSEGKTVKRLRSGVVAITKRATIQGKDQSRIVRELASAFDQARRSALLPANLADEIKALENR